VVFRVVSWIVLLSLLLLSGVSATGSPQSY
jgi:hypothetical protein